MESNGKERAVRLLGRSRLLLSLRGVWVRTRRAYPFCKVLPSGGAFHKPSAGGLLWPVA
jgi:hypothetical protein